MSYVTCQLCCMPHAKCHMSNHMSSYVICPMSCHMRDICGRLKSKKFRNKCKYDMIIDIWILICMASGMTWYDVWPRQSGEARGLRLRMFHVNLLLLLLLLLISCLLLVSVSSMPHVTCHHRIIEWKYKIVNSIICRHILS